MDNHILRGSSRVKLLAALAIIAMTFASLACVPADADDGNVTTWDELKDAIEDGPDSVSIVLGNDIIDDSDDGAIEIGDDRNVRIDLNGYKIDRQRGTPDGKDGRLFEISGMGTYVYISNGTLTGGHGGDGGCIYLDEARWVQLTDVNVIGNYSDGDGGAIYADRSMISISGGKVADNACDGDGGVAYIENDSLLEISGSEICGNHADDGDGGVIYSEDSIYIITDSDVHDNYCDGDGGVVYAEGGSDYYSQDIRFDRTTFTGNHTAKSDDSDGGVVYLDDSKLIIDSSTFDGNYCGFDGGAIYIEDSDLEVRSPTVFKNNNAPDSGGALRIHGGSALLVDTVFEGNHANSCGGGVYINNDAVAYFKNATFTGNNVLMDGGGLLVGDDENKVTIEGKIILKDNKAERDGNNTFIRSDRTIICNKLEEGTVIGVELADGDDSFTEKFGENNLGVDPAKFFFSDDPNYYVGSDGGEAKMYKSGTSGDMSDNTIWIVVGIIAAVLVVAAVVYVVKTRKP